MPNNEAVARLVVETGGTQAVDELRAKVADVQAKITDLGQAYKDGHVDIGYYTQRVSALSTEEAKLTSVVDACDNEIKRLGSTANVTSDALRDLGISLTNVKGGTTAAGKAVGDIADKMSLARQRFTAASYALQDFGSAGGGLGQKLNAISNNIPQMLAGLGNVGLVASVAVTGIAAVVQNWDTIKGLWEERTPIKAADDLKSLKKELDNTTEAIDKMAKKGSLNAAEMEKYNGLRTKAAEIESRYTKEKKEQDDLAKAEEKRRQKVAQIVNQRSPEEQERAGNVMKAISNEGEQLRTGLTKIGMDGEREAADNEHHAAYQKASKLPYEQRIAAQNRADKKFADRMEKAKKSTERMTNRLLDDLSEGDEEAYKQLNLIMDHHDDPLLFGRGLRNRIREADPAKVKAKKEADEKKKAENKLIEELNEQGQENYRLGQAEAEKDEAKEDKAEKKADGKETKGKEKLTKKSAAELEHTFGKDWGQMYEARMAANMSAGMNGAPVARNKIEEEAYQMAGQEYALPPRALHARMQTQMINSMIRNGGDEDAALHATQSITDKGDHDLMGRMANTANSGLAANVAAYNVASQLNSEVQRLGQQQNMIMQQWQRLQKETSPESRGFQNRGGR